MTLRDPGGWRRSAKGIHDVNSVVQAFRQDSRIPGIAKDNPGISQRRCHRSGRRSPGHDSHRPLILQVSTRDFRAQEARSTEDNHATE
jgi:hypothetical protein